jgi:indolepyruvate ferredoxin oxidoreductase beta subunit
MSSHTIVYMNTAPVVPFIVGQRIALKEENAEYPDVQRLCDAIRDVTAHAFAIDATRRAAEAGSIQSLNVVMLGCLLGSGALPCDSDAFWSIAKTKIPSRLLETNERAFRCGIEIAGQLSMAGERV